MLVPRQQSDGNALDVVVRDIVYQGDHIRLRAESAYGPLIIRAERRAPRVVIGDHVKAVFPAEDCWVLPS
jgi:hypothetical protein